MKNLFTYIKRITLFALIAMASSCSDDFLEVPVKGKLTAETTSDYELLLKNEDFYRQTGGIRVGLAPDVCLLSEFAQSFVNPEKAQAFQWTEDVYLSDENMTIVQNHTKNLYAYNKIIEEVPNSLEGTEDEKRRILAEALTGRAWINFDLIDYFSKPYNASTASTDLAFPIITEKEITQTFFEQSTVEEMYQHIINDLTTAMPDLPILTQRLRPSKGGAMALLGKVYMAKGEYQKAIDFIDDAFDEFANGAIPAGLYDYNVDLGVAIPSNPILGASSIQPIDHNENPFGRYYDNPDGGFLQETFLTPETIALYDPTDPRKLFFAGNQFFSLPSFPVYPAGVFKKRGSGNTPSRAANIPDLYLLRAEAKARLDDLAGAVTDVEFFRTHRLPPAGTFVITSFSPFAFAISQGPEVPTAIASDKNQLLNFIMDERIREFCGTGIEWSTTRRIFSDPIFSGRTYVHNEYAEDGTINATYTLTEDRLVLRYNESFMNQNPNFINNP